MRHLRNSRHSLAILFGLLLGWSSVARGADFTYNGDPVEALKQALRGSGVDQEARLKALETRAKALKVGDLRRALILQDWHDEERSFAESDRVVRDSIVTRLEKVLRDGLASNDRDRQLAAATSIGEMGFAVRGGGARVPLTRNLVPDLVKVMGRGNDSVREAAARALGKINPPPDEATKALAQMLGTGEVGQRQAAADALATMLRAPMQTAKATATSPGLQPTLDEIARSAKAVVPVAGRGLNDTNAEVRRNCLEAVQLAAAILREQESVANPLALALAGAEGRKTLLDIADQLNEQSKSVADLLKDADPLNRLLAARTLEEIGLARQKLVRRLADGADPLRQGLLDTIGKLEKATTDQDVRVRIAALESLETLGPQAAPAAEAAVVALGDCNRFVRWSAARLLNRMGPVKTKLTVPAIAQLLTDPDLDVRLAAAAALEHYGTAAASAIAKLTSAVTFGDEEQRLAVTKAILSLGIENSQSAIPALTLGLAHPDARVRRFSAEALGVYGPAAESSAAALRQAMSDPDDGVRKAAADALLAVETKE